MVDGTTTATTTTTEMLGLTTNTNTTTTQETVSTMNGSVREHYGSTFTSMDSSDDDSNSLCPALVLLSDSEDSDKGFLYPSSESARIRLPSGRTISKKANGPHTSKHRHRRTPSPNTRNHIHSSRKVQGNCALLPNSVTVEKPMSALRPRHPPTPLTSDSESEYDQISITTTNRETPNSLLAPHIRLATHRTTIRSSDAQMLAMLPASTQRSLLATTRKAVERAGREEQEYRRKLDGYGNLKSKERFVNDVPGGKSHKNRFMAQ
ncbi:uncharacterized protein CC84DRAFT_321713 [Paraphaeosphaeria sporulosa]|uniref:Uncharacterized protein n=1 Tax=Paraphaeosphaeria sporulosa TaxID=1460663 RepID=A0A177BZT6_9PLEO|nr:uncharacterized protein CC84DRAFT_321713 [Paraphaeosphaeria sporulosa]OAG00676.1 hypothetical protein CC84DRAFT_321713 [Paraphaeosphaeria sporulosa]